MRLMSVAEIKQAIEKLTPQEKGKVFQFVHDLEAKHRMSGRQLTGLAEKLSHAKDPAEISRLREEIGQGFYGTKS